MKKSPPPCMTGVAFVRARYGRDTLAALTGQDHRALGAWLHLLELYAVADTNGQAAALVACGALLEGMQRSAWPIAKAAIPAVLDWSHEETLWRRVLEVRELRA